MTDFWNTTLEAVEDIREHPPGRYLGYISGYKLEVTDDNKPFAILEFKASEGISGQDLDGVELNRTLRSQRLYFTDKAAKYSKAALKKVNPDLNDKVPLKETFESLVGVEVKFDYKAEKSANGKEYMNVVGFVAA
jgi:hypothetical protein